MGVDEVRSSGRRVGQSLRRFAARHRGVAHVWRRLMRLRATPHEVALGCAAGVFAACTPLLGLQMILAGLLAFMLRVSIPAAILGTFIGNPLSWPAIWSASYLAGSWILGLDPAYAADHLSESANVLSATILMPSPETLNMAVVSVSPIIGPLLVGGLAVGLILGVGSYYPMRRAVRVFQKSKRPH